jgi:hypothetical protein
MQVRPMGVVRVPLEPNVKPPNQFTLDCYAVNDDRLDEQLDRGEGVPGANGCVNMVVFSGSELIACEFG